MSDHTWWTPARRKMYGRQTPNGITCQSCGHDVCQCEPRAATVGEHVDAVLAAKDAEIERLRQKVDDLRVIANVNGDWNGRFAVALAMLRELEWRGWERTSQPYDPPAHGRACLVCGGLQSQGHKPDCRLDAFLAGGGKGER